MTTRDELEHELKALIIEALALEDLSPADIVATDPLFVEGLGLDSIDALEIAMVLEQRYGVVGDDDEEENRRRYASVRGLAEWVSVARTK